MTRVVITKKNDQITSIECDGHTGYGVEGEDIVCSALSSIVQTAVLGLFSVAGVNVSLVRDETRGYLKATLPENMTEEQMHDSQVILATMQLGICDLREGFSDFIELEVK
jgi:uncharacterized protein YsxB (DUF464 family)